ncbi:O-antigen ligase family protein [Argonema galeatum]|uniref:O-antigen ligase family protein n=1 Tax=Argonema galeatum TaxID=2942762 RepID=UPI002011300C|nr:O-antigen ligase family protein [Argonema galeatum]MCL1465136.1 O-antigen ligase family protein [Argonema galeatum A003/A1]
MKPKFKIENLKSILDPSLELCWNFAQLGLLIFPLFPALGAVPLALAILGTGKQKFNTIIKRPLNWGIAVLSLLLVFSASLAFNRPEAFLGLANFLPFFLLLISFGELIQTPTQLRRVAWILVLPSLPIVILGYLQLFLSWGSPSLLETIVGYAIAPTGNPPGRMASVFMYANILAAYLTIVFILAQGLLIENWQLATKRAEERGKITNSQSLFLIVVVIANAIALILTNSRNAWALAPLACLAFAVYLGWRWLVAAVAGIGGIVLSAAYAPSPINELLRKIVPAFFWARLTDQMYQNRPIPFLRTTQWNFALWMTQQRPLTGWGLRNFTPLYVAKYSTTQIPIWLGHPHSLFLMLTAEIGIPIAMLFFTLVGWVIAQSILLLRDWPGNSQDRLILFSFIVAFLGCTLFNTVDVTLFDLRVNTLGWLLLAAICGVVYHSRVK